MFSSFFLFFNSRNLGFSKFSKFGHLAKIAGQDMWVVLVHAPIRNCKMPCLRPGFCFGRPLESLQYNTSIIYLYIYIYTYIYILIYVCTNWLYIYIYDYRRKFRSQTSDNMDRWKAEQGRGREKRKIRREKIREEKESEERRCRCAKR